MPMSLTGVDFSDQLRLAPQRYFNLFRLLIAGFFLVVGRELNLGNEAPQFYLLLTGAYLGLVLLLGFPDMVTRVGLDRLISVQVIIDLVVLSGIMWVSGGYRSGMPVMMMVYLAAAGLVAEGRMVLFFAAFATVVVLSENAWRAFSGGNASEFLQVGISCIGFFAIALTARLLARRAKANEFLAEQRGEALGRQQAVNERIIRDMQDGVIVLSSDGRVRQSNPRASVLLGADLQPGMELALVDVVLADCLSPDPDQHGVLRRIGPAGKLLRCRTAGSGVSGEGGSADTLIYLTDFEEIQKQVQQLKLAALGRLTASMAHEIRNPLSAVTQAAELLGDEKRSDMRARLLRIINDNARRIERMVRDVLALGRRDQLMREALPLGAMVENVIEEFALKGDSEAAVFAVDVDQTLSLAMDRAHLHQILANLFNNARRFCTGAPASVRISAREFESGRIEIHIEDDGPGVAEADQSLLFDPFFTTDAKGTGLGLYIARELAEANDASLEYAGNTPGAHFVLRGRKQP